MTRAQTAAHPPSTHSVAAWTLDAAKVSIAVLMSTGRSTLLEAALDVGIAALRRSDQPGQAS